MTLQQLRIYEFFDRDQCMPIMARYGFRILATWDTSFDDRREFCYVLEWPDVATMRDAWERFLGDEEGREIKRRTAAQHGDLVGGIEDRVLRLTDYSPSGRAP